MSSEVQVGRGGAWAQALPGGSQAGSSLLLGLSMAQLCACLVLGQGCLLFLPFLPASPVVSFLHRVGRGAPPLDSASVCPSLPTEKPRTWGWSFKTRMSQCLLLLDLCLPCGLFRTFESWRGAQWVGLLS